MKFFKIFLIIAVILLTVIICNAKPKLHKVFVITGSNFKLERYTESTVNKKIVNAEQKNYGSNRNVKIEPSAFLTEEKNVKMDDVKPETEEQLINSNVPKEVADAFAELEPKNDKVKTKQLTKREEIIAWNKWRSDLQNEIMLKSEVSAPIGTMFYFSFKVDKFRHISNIRAGCSNPFYQKEVKDKLLPMIKKIEYTQILEFPEGSLRDETKFNGMFIIWNETSLANPGDFSDIERVNVYE